MPQISKIIGNNISRLRIERGLTQQALADKCGFVRGTITKTEAGLSGFHLDTIQRIAAALEVEESVLFQDQKETLELALLSERSVQAFQKAEEVQQIYKQAYETITNIPIDIMQSLKLMTPKDFESLKPAISGILKGRAKNAIQADLEETRKVPQSKAKQGA